MPASLSGHGRTGAYRCGRQPAAPRFDEDGHPIEELNLLDGAEYPTAVGIFDDYWQDLPPEDRAKSDIAIDCATDVATAHIIGGGDQEIWNHPKSRSDVVVTAMTLQDADPSHVAYIETCRTQRLRRSGEPSPTGRRLPQAIIRATESIRLENGTWKLAGRWDYTVDDLDAGC